MCSSDLESLDTRQAIMTTRTSETLDGRFEGEKDVPAGDWAWAKCDETNPFPGTPDPTQVCVRGGFDPKLLYQIVFTARDPLVLGIGFAAWRDVGDFFRNAKADAEGTPNPLAGAIRHSIGRGSSQSGNFLRAFLHLGFNERESGGRLHDGQWPIIAGRRVSLNTRFAMPDGVLKLYEPGSEGPQWWVPWPDKVRGLPAVSILDRCTADRKSTRLNSSH